MVKLSFSPGKITCLFCGDTQTDEDLMGHISVKHLNYLRFKCSECEFKSVYPDEILEHSLNESHSSWTDDWDENQFVTALITCVLKLSRLASKIHNVDTVIKLVDQMISIADGNPIMKIKKETSDVGTQCSMQSTSDRSDIELQADYESPEVVKFLNSLKDLDSPFMNEDMPRLTPVPTFKHEVSTTESSRPSASDSAALERPAWVRTPAAASSQISPSATLSDSDNDETDDLSSYVRLLQENLEESEDERNTLKKRKRKANLKTAKKQLSGKRRGKPKAAWKSDLKNCHVCQLDLTKLSAAQLDKHVVKHMLAERTGPVHFHICPHCGAGTRDFDGYMFKRNHLDKLHPGQERYLISHVENFKEEIAHWAHKCFFGE